MNKKWMLLVPAVAFLGGCAGLLGNQPSPEETAQRQELIKQYMAKLKHRGEVTPTDQVTPTTVAPAGPTVVGDIEFRKSIEAFPPLAKGVSFTKKQDGFLVDGHRYIDPEGQIRYYGLDAKSGDVTYLIKTGGDSYVAKYVRATTGMEPVKIGDASFSDGDWKITTVTGKSFSGSKLIPLGKGFIVAREDGSGFVWSPDRALQTFAIPDGFQVTDFQNGDIAGTRLILCERLIEGQSVDDGGLGSLVNSVKNLGSTLGIGQKEDYLLLNIDTETTVPINISYDNKNEVVHSNCRPAGKFVNKCANAQFYESLYDKYGNPNGGHYFWAINWYNTASGPLLLFKDNNGRDLIAQNLKSNEKAVVLSRLLGINWFTSSQNSDGKVSITAKMGFGKQTVEDVETALATKIVEASSAQK